MHVMSRARALLAVCFLLPALPAFAQTVAFPPAPTVKLAVNPVTNKVYMVNELANGVSVFDATAGTTTTVPVGQRPQFIALNPVTNKVYVNNAGDATLSIIDGATDANLTPAALAIGSIGPISVNPLTNVIYVVRLTGPGSDEVTFFNGDTNSWYTIATQSFQPIAMAVNPATDTIYVAHYATGDVRIISGAFDPAHDFPATFSIGVFSHPFAIAANPVTNRVYAITEDSRGPIVVIDGAAQTASFPAPAAGHAVGPKGLAVNPVTNRIYMLFGGEVVVMDGATNALAYVPVATGTGQAEIAVNPVTNKVFVASDGGTLTVIDGDTNIATTVAIPAGASALGVDPVRNVAYTFDAALTAVAGAPGDTVHANPITTTITPLPNDTSGADVTFSLAASSAFAPNALPVGRVYVQLDSTAGRWIAASGSGPFSASFTGLAGGAHTLFAFAADGQDAPLASGDVTILPGSVASYAFRVSTKAAPGVSLASSANPSIVGRSVTFSASVAGTAGTPTGTVDFRDGATPIGGCTGIALASGHAACSTASLAAGAHSITAAYGGDANYSPGTSSALGQAVNLDSATVGLGSSANPSLVGATVTFTASVTGGSGSGSGVVDFRDGGTTISGCAGVALVSGSASCSTPSLALGTHSITAAYGGDAHYAPATSPALSQVVQDTPPPLPKASFSPTAIDFGGESMGTTSPVKDVVVTNTGGGTLTIGSIGVSSAQFAVSSDCSTLAPGAACTIHVTFTPAATPGALGSTAAVTGTLSVASNGDGSPNTASLSGTAEKSLVTHFYRSILRRDPDAAGKAFWQDEALRLQGLGANPNETWYAMAAAFFFSPEYATPGHDDTGFVTDLYNTFFNRAPDANGLAFWTQRIASGMPRENVLDGFMFSPEFATFTQAIFGNSAARAEVDTVMDFYRGVLGRLPDIAGFDFWVRQFRAAQCQGQSAVFSQVASISSQFLNGAEYANRNRNNGQFVGDLYNAFLRRGGDLDGVRFWIGQLDGGSLSRDQERASFISTPEFTSRVNAIVAQGCMQ
jgi:YVTN family beta-propeller protein